MCVDFQQVCSSCVVLYQITIQMTFDQYLVKSLLLLSKVVRRANACDNKSAPHLLFSTSHLSN